MTDRGVYVLAADYYDQQRLEEVADCIAAALDLNMAAPAGRV